MGTTGQNAFDDAQIPLMSLIPEPLDRPAAEEKDAGSRQDQGVPWRIDAAELRAKARDASSAWKPCAKGRHEPSFPAKWKAVSGSIVEACRASVKARASRSTPCVTIELLADHSALLCQAVTQTKSAMRAVDQLPVVITGDEHCAPRIYVSAESFLDAVNWRVQSKDLPVFFEAMQESFFFEDAELSALRPCLQLILLERINTLAEESVSGEQDSAATSGDGLQRALRSLIELTKLEWNDVFETLSETDRILRQDPARVYSEMDAETRARYHSAIADMARRSSWSEVEVAHEAVRLARGPHDTGDIRASERRSHVGYYLIDRGQYIIKEASGYRPTLADRVRATLRRWPAFFYISTIASFTIGILAAVAAVAGASTSLPGRSAVILMVAFIPVTECAIALTNLLVTHLMKPERLPRLDFSDGLPSECSTLVAIPILISSEKQVRQAVRDLEIRYLGNRDRNLHFALVTDVPDSLEPFDKHDALAGLCSSLIEELNAKYARHSAGSFIHLHRHRVYNSGEKIWMGWERKRGKLLDLNALLLGQADRFPVKAGNLGVLSSIRYVITLDQDTQLLTESARKLAGALAHPLNRAVVDPVTNRVVEGYAILQPRVSISVKSARRSRLAAIFSGDSNFDVYTRAVSDIYQDLFGAGIYTGKGIYEVAIFQQVLENRFPSNTILSHDLIEGAYARTGFISDLELIDDYPSHISAYTRRKHRWVRGDWQILFWLFPRVPESFGKLVPNPLSVISRWQIFDNLRRSLSEVSTFALLLCGWMLWPKQAFLWTMIALALAASPICLDFFVSLIGAGRNLFTLSFWKNTTTGLAAKSYLLLCRIALLCHQSLIAIDAVVRTTVRMTVTHLRLLQWETADQAELAQRDKSKDLVERYLSWTVPAALAIAFLLARFFPSSLLIALPFLMLWGTSKVFCDWLSRPSPIFTRKIAVADQTLLRHIALRTWRFFSEFCTEEDNWLIPDVVQAEPPIVVHAASPTNLGLLLNAQLAAYDLGFLVLPQFVTAAERTIGTISELPTSNGQFYNWYDTHTLQPRSPRFISTADNGNFVCCLWTLKGACAELKHAPLLPPSLQPGISAYLDAIESGLPEQLHSKSFAESIRGLRRCVDSQGLSQSDWLANLPQMVTEVDSLEQQLVSFAPESEAAWWAKALSSLVRDMQEMVLDFVPWLSQELAGLRSLGSLLSDLPDADLLTPETIVPALTELRTQVEARLNGQEINEAARPLAVCFSEALSRSIEISQRMLDRLSAVEALAERLADDQDFSLFYSAQKKLLSIGYDAEARRQWDSHYDLLASEARAAIFVAVAKGDVSQKVWFRTDRPMAVVNGRSATLSWTGTMFEYLLPTLWIKVFPNTLLEQAGETAVLAQRRYTKERLIPWGMSECSCADKGADGRYSYRAVGVPELAISAINADDLVISPYSAFLALMADGPVAASNLRDMCDRGWLRRYGFCDAYDFTAGRLRSGKTCEVVACWMAHHQGMSLVAVANALNGNVMQRRFHAEPMVVATERLLQEASRHAPGDRPEESRKLELESFVPLLRNVWQSAPAARLGKSVVAAADRVRETSAGPGGVTDAGSAQGA